MVQEMFVFMLHMFVYDIITALVKFSVVDSDASCKDFSALSVSVNSLLLS